MEFVNVLVAAVATWIFGAVWYMSISKPWMEASGLTPETIDNKNPTPFIVSFIGAVIVAGMLRHVLAGAQIETVGKSLLTGLGMGAFIVSPWIVNNVLYGQRDKRLIWMDCGYPVIGMGIMGLVLALF